MRIIPVLDLKDGVVVRGEGGRRDHYRPIETPLVEGCEPGAIAEALIAASGASEIYIADLDAIAGARPQSSIVAGLVERFAEVTVWLDAGFRSRSDAGRRVRMIAGEEGAGRIVPVIGSETLGGLDGLRGADDRAPYILSLDFGAEGYRGPQGLLAHPEAWPQSVIVMTLANVGTGGGPDRERLEEIAARAAGRTIFAAGGVRGPEDLELLQRIGVGGALVASALHTGRIGRAVKSQAAATDGRT